MAKDLKVTITVNLIPHPNPKAAIDLVAEIVTRQLVKRTEDLPRVCEKVG